MRGEPLVENRKNFGKRYQGAESQVDNVTSEHIQNTADP